MKRIFSVALLMLVAVWPALAQPAVKGTYNGLFYDPDLFEQQSSGSFTVSTTPSGSFSGKLQLNRTRITFTGKLDSSGKTNLTLHPKNLSPLTLTLQLDGTDQITGSLSDGVWTAQLAGDRAVFNAKTNPAPQAGRYTLVFRGHYNSTTEPAGDSICTVSIDAGGKISLSGTLADATKITQASTLAENGNWPFYVLLYSGGGSLLSWIKVDDDPDDPDDVFKGDSNWIKPVVAKAKYYPAGFTSQSEVHGSSYQPPTTGAPALSFISGEMIFSGADLPQPFTNCVLWDSGNKIRNLSSNKLTATVVAGTGAFSGSVTNPSTGKTYAFNGVVLQETESGCGFFTSSNQTGRVQFRAKTGDIVDFKTTGATFSPEIYFGFLPDSFRWSWGDNTTSIDYPVASKNFGKKGVRHQYLTSYPDGVLTSINLGFDASDGGQTTPLTNRPQQNVSAVYFPYPLTGLRFWASSYNPIANGLDFSGFTSLEAIECFHCEKLGSVVVTNLPSLKRLCLEECNLQQLNLTGLPALEDVRAAINVFTNVVLGDGTGPNIWHWCTRNNPNITQNFQDVMTNFFSLRELWIWDDNQSGALTAVSTHLTDVKANDNYYTSADFTGQANLENCWLFNNSLTNLVITGCVGLKDLDAHNNQLTGPVLDAILVELAASAHDLQTVNLSQNAEFPSQIGLTAYTNLLNSDVVVQLDLP
jgi:hypothetical protein